MEEQCFKFTPSHPNRWSSSQVIIVKGDIYMIYSVVQEYLYLTFFLLPVSHKLAVVVFDLQDNTKY